jgi:hypothetical protein
MYARQPASFEIKPIPGDPSGVRSEASKYTATADAVRNAASEMRRLAADSAMGESEAITALVEASDEVSERLESLHGRYETAGSALTTYASSLETAQQLALTAVATRDAAAEASASAANSAQAYENEAMAATTPEEKAEAERMQRAHESSIDAATGDLAGAQAAYDRAIEMRNTAAQTAADLISAAIRSDGMNDSLWDDFSGWVTENAEILKVIKDVLGYIATGLAIASLFLAPFALAAAGLTALLSLALSATGNQSWVEFGLDFLAFATLGVGAIAGRALKTTMGLLKATRVGKLSQYGLPKAVRTVNSNWSGVQAAKIGNVLKKPSEAWRGLMMIKETMGARGIGNAQALRVLNGARAGIGSPMDAMLVTMGKTQIAAATVSASVSGWISKANTGLNQADNIGGLIEQYAGNTIDQFVPGGAEKTADFLSGVTDTWTGIKDDSTWKVGS